MSYLYEMLVSNKSEDGANRKEISFLSSSFILDYKIRFFLNLTI